MYAQPMAMNVVLFLILIITLAFSDKTYINKYDFALHKSIYKLVDSGTLKHDDANAKCAELLDYSGHLARFETMAELEAVSREVLARHIGEHFVYWVGGDPVLDNTTAIARLFHGIAKKAGG